MRPELELLAGNAAKGPGPEPAFLGARWALGLGLALLAGFALATAARWWETAGSSSGGPETVIQQPVPPDPFPAANRADSTAPDPGDNPAP